MNLQRGHPVGGGGLIFLGGSCQDLLGWSDITLLFIK